MARESSHSQETYWVRLKPYNPKRGQLVRRTCIPHPLFNCRVFAGGDGITEIPEWVRVSREQADVLAGYKQTSDIEAKGMFDIVTEAQMKEIDAAEEEFRKARLGYGSKNIQEMPVVEARKTSAITLEDVTGKPSPVSEKPSTILEDKAPSKVAAPRHDIAGRAAAMDGFNSIDMNEDDTGGHVEASVPPPAPIPVPQPPLALKGPRGRRGRGV